MQSSRNSLFKPIKEAPSTASYDLYLFDFDYTLTQEHSEEVDEDNLPEVANNMKPYVAAAFKAINASPNFVGIVTRNPDNEVIIKHLIGAGLSPEEAAQIQIKNRNIMPKGSKKPDWVISYIKEHPNAKNIYYYDDEAEFLSASSEQFKREKASGNYTHQELHCVEIPLVADYADHLKAILTKLPRLSSTLLQNHFLNKSSSTPTKITSNLSLHSRSHSIG